MSLTACHSFGDKRRFNLERGPTRGRLELLLSAHPIIEIKEREQHRVGVFMTNVNQSGKAIVFCATQDHSAAARDLIN